MSRRSRLSIQEVPLSLLNLLVPLSLLVPLVLVPLLVPLALVPLGDPLPLAAPVALGRPRERGL